MGEAAPSDALHAASDRKTRPLATQLAHRTVRLDVSSEDSGDKVHAVLL